jgi:predicted DNA-binding protein with PD1-like motif
MKSRLLQVQPPRTYVIVFDKEEEFITSLTAFASDQRLEGSHFTAIGAFSAVALGYFDRKRKEYKKIPLNEQVEVLSLVGNIADDQGRPKVHAHVVVGKADGTARGGHILEAHVWPTLELVVEDEPEHLRRRTDPATGLALIDISAE